MVWLIVASREYRVSRLLRRRVRWLTRRTNSWGGKTASKLKLPRNCSCELAKHDCISRFSSVIWEDPSLWKHVSATAQFVLARCVNTVWLMWLLLYSALFEGLSICIYFSLILDPWPKVQVLPCFTSQKALFNSKKLLWSVNKNTTSQYYIISWKP